MLVWLADSYGYFKYLKEQTKYKNDNCEVNEVEVSGPFACTASSKSLLLFRYLFTLIPYFAFFLLNRATQIV